MRPKGEVTAGEEDVILFDGSKIEPTTNPYHGAPEISWGPENSSWYAKFFVIRPNGSSFLVPVAGCTVYISGVKPPKKTTTYTLKSDYTSLASGEACVHFFWGNVTNEPGWEQWSDYYSVGGTIELIVHDDKVTVSIEDITVQTQDGSKSGVLTANYACQ